MVNHEIPMREDEETTSETIKFLWGKIRKWMVNRQIPLRKDKNTYGKPK